ncbi:hypothetical protein Taro_044692 [Colocasia esculenta]|uniref:Uncharacterized protein n=1 Tax=Colocasia esculenta TaxID=4460 RepID=A0A843X1B9_COLES|nr:hypothetical protein [Colocasia esculenta]
MFDDPGGYPLETDCPRVIEYGIDGSRYGLADSVNHDWEASLAGPAPYAPGPPTSLRLSAGPASSPASSRRASRASLAFPRLCVLRPGSQTTTPRCKTSQTVRVDQLCAATRIDRSRFFPLLATSLRRTNLALGLPLSRWRPETVGSRLLRRAKHPEPPDSPPPLRSSIAPDFRGYHERREILTLCAAILIEKMVVECSSMRWKLSEDPVWISIKNDLCELRDMFATALQKTNPALDVKCEEQGQVVIYEADATLADEYEVEMRTWSELQDLHNGQARPQNMLSEVLSLVSDSCVCTESEIDDTWDPKLLSLLGLQSISYSVFEVDRLIGSLSTAVVDFEFAIEDFDVVWLDFCDAYIGRQFGICDMVRWV